MKAVEITRPDGTTTPGLELQRRVDGDQCSQARVVVAISDGDGVAEVDTAADRVEPIEGEQAALVRDVLGDRLEGDGSD